MAFIVMLMEIFNDRFFAPRVRIERQKSVTVESLCNTDLVSNVIFPL